MSLHCSPPHLPGSYLVLELTNRCSLACVHCSVSEKDHPHHIQTGYLDPNLVTSLLEDLAKNGVRFDTLILFWLGEPLLHPHFGQIWRACIRSAVDHGTFQQIEVHTNATHLDQNRIQAALNNAAVPQVWHFSVDARDPKTYLDVKGRDRFAAVEENITSFLNARGQTGAKWPRPVLQFIVGSNNTHNVGPFREHWTQICNNANVPVRAAAGHVPPGSDCILFFRQLDCPTPALQERENQVFRDAMAAQNLALPIESSNDRPIEARNLAPCSGFWKSPVISWQGDVTVCTRDNGLENSVGNLSDQSFSALWWGAQMRQRRLNVAAGDYTELSLCQSCFIPRSLNHTTLTQQDVDRQAEHDRRVENA